MGGSGPRWTLVVLLIISLVLTILLIPGVGVETRKLASFPGWQQSLYPIGGPVLVIVTLLAIATAVRWPRVGGSLAILSGILSLLLSGVGVALLGAPSAPTSVLTIDSIHIIVSFGVLIVGAVVAARGTPSPPPPAPPLTGTPSPPPAAPP